MHIQRLMIEDLGVLFKGSFVKVSYYSVFFLLVETELIWSASVETGAIQRGVYLREIHDCQRASEVYICGNMLEKALNAWEVSP